MLFKNQPLGEEPVKIEKKNSSSDKVTLTHRANDSELQRTLQNGILALFLPSEAQLPGLTPRNW